MIKRVRLEGVYLKRKYSHCPILMECKFLCCVVSRLFIFYFDPILASGWKLRFEANRKSTYFWRHKMTMGGWYWWISFKGDRLTSEHKLGVALNAFYINCKPFENEEKKERERKPGARYLDVRSILFRYNIYEIWWLIVWPSAWYIQFDIV